MWLEVTASTLNLRSKPLVTPSTRIASLQQGQVVRKLADAARGWIEVEARFGRTAMRGFVKSSYLASAAAPFEGGPPVTQVPPAVHLSPAKGSRASQSAMAFPLREAGMPPARDADASLSDKVASLHGSIAWLDVESSRRYVPGNGRTYCNIYAYDYACLAGVYLPRVWWMNRALMQIEQGSNPPVHYGVTVSERNANSLYDWFYEWAEDFGWSRLASADDAQSAANEGEAVIVCAKRKDLQRSGHITAVVPETDAPGDFAAERRNGEVTKPLLSQAGAVNHRYVASNFYLGAQFQAFGFWSHA